MADNGDPWNSELLRVWRKAWREADYSWEGLKHFEWEGWSVNSSGRLQETRRLGSRRPARQATLQDYWRCGPGSGRETAWVDDPALDAAMSKSGELVADGEGRLWHIMHAPLALSADDEPPLFGAATAEFRVGIIRDRIKAAVNADAGRPKDAEADAPDWRAQFRGVALLDLNITDYRFAPATPGEPERIPLHIDFNNAAFSGYAVFENAAFSGDAGFKNAAFSGDAGFENAAFSGYAWFENAAFSGYAGFYSAAFSGDARFENAAFSGGAGFENAAFSGNAGFNKAAFSGDAWFYKAAFSGYARFDNAAFSGDAGFTNAAFSGDARFNKAAFSGNAWFVNAAFSGDAGFDNAAFSGDAGFYSAAFSGDARFKNAAFSGDAGFENAAFSGYAWFENAAFSGDAGFYSAAFSGDAGFDNAAFSGDARFENAAFSGDAGFENAAFSGYAVFENVLFARAADFVGQGAFSSLSMAGAVFLGDVSFANREFLQPASFARARFFGAVKLHGAALHPGVSFHGAELDPVLGDERGRWSRLTRGPGPAPPKPPKAAEVGIDRLFQAEVRLRERLGGSEPDKVTWRRDFDGAWGEWRATRYSNLIESYDHDVKAAASDRFAELESAYRALKHAMEQVRNRAEEGRYFRLELMARRERRDQAVPVWERGLSYVYDWTADYGASIVRPLGWLAGLWLVFGAVYWVAALYALSGGADVWAALQYSGSRAFPFGAFGFGAGKDWIDALQVGDPLGGFLLRVLATIQSLVSLVLAFLSALAVRRRFQIT